jgi:DNA-directed RNA polymerase specialized sigma24 family protein
MGPEQCEDILQDVLLSIHLKRQTWREDAPIRPWLYAIARHKVVDAFRARGTRINVSIDDFP